MKTPPVAPMVPMPIMEKPFEQIVIDTTGLFPKSSESYQYVLVIMDYPEAIPLHSTMAPKITGELLKFILRVGIRKEILIDRGTYFMAGIMKGICETFQVKQLRTSIFYP